MKDIETTSAYTSLVEKIVKAVPEIATNNGFLDMEQRWDITYRNIGIADVLRVMRKKRRPDYSMLVSKLLVTLSDCQWHLDHDSLEWHRDHAPESILFLDSVI
jgi:hypothetical protein